MFEILGGILGNAHFEAYVGGPAAGLILGCVFSALGSRPSIGSHQSQQSPTEVRNRIEKHADPLKVKEVHHHHYHHKTNGGSNDDGGVIIVIAGLVLITALLIFAAFLPQIAYVLCFFVTAIATFSITACLLAIFTGQFNTPQWWMHSVFPLFVSMGCFYVIVTAEQSISAEVVVYARGLLGNGSINFGIVLGSAFEFIKTVKSDYSQWMFFEMLAFACVTICALLISLQCIYYISLSNTRAEKGRMWEVLTLWTDRFSGMGTLSFISILLGAAWFLATGQMYQLLH